MCCLYMYVCSVAIATLEEVVFCALVWHVMASNVKGRLPCQHLV